MLRIRLLDYVELHRSESDASFLQQVFDWSRSTISFMASFPVEKPFFASYVLENEYEQ